jgi:hypothetical protein
MLPRLAIGQLMSRSSRPVGNETLQDHPLIQREFSILLEGPFFRLMRPMRVQDARSRRGHRLASVTEGGKRSFTVISVQTRCVALAHRQRADPHPDRHGNNEFTDVMHMARPEVRPL